MNLPYLTPSQQKTLITTTFKGYNHNQSIGDGEMYDMKNMSSISFPLLDQRPKRAVMTLQGNALLTGIAGRDDLVTIRGTEVYYGETLVSGISVSENAAMLPKMIASMGAYVCIWPDKVYFNTTALSDCGSMETSFSISGSNTSLIMCRSDGTNYDYEQITVSNTAPASPTAGQLWLDTSGANHVLRQYSSSNAEWVEVASTYIKISATGIGNGISVYDTVTISGMTAPAGASSAVANQITALNGDNIVYGAGNNYLIVAGLISQYVSALAENTVTSSRTVPDLDYVCESNNRLWGCRYGIENGSTINEIRACKLGDFKNWRSFMGISGDSYTVSIGTDGPFTGCASQRGYPVFFKENCIHRISGTSPSSFTVSTVTCRGMQDGSWRSAVVVNENIYYKSIDGIMVFDGSMPYSVSSELGAIKYSDARAGQVGGKYYVSMMDRNDEWSLFVYDTNLKLWHREDDLKVLGFGTVNGELYAIDEEANKIIMMTGMNPEEYEYALEEDFDWYAVFGLFGTDYTNQKYLSRFNLRMQMEEGSKVRLQIQYDQDGIWHDEGEIKQRSTRTFLLPVIPRRCDHLQFKLSGKGRCRIYSISRVLEVGGDG